MCVGNKPWRVRYLYRFLNGDFSDRIVAYKSEANARRGIATERIVAGDRLKSVQVYRYDLLTES